jgi:dihydroflavonol-4-reductase
VKPTPTGQMVLDFLRGRIFATVDTGLNVVHVRDVARGHLLAAERGKPGARYILGHQNLRLDELFALMADITGRRPPRFTVPHAMAWMAATCCEGVAAVTRRPPAVTLAAVRMARKKMYFSAARAVRELGLPQTDVREALADAIAWFTSHGYVARRPIKN